MPAEVDALWEGVPTRTSAFQSGEDNALKRLAHFVETALVHYDQQRDFPSLDGTSQLSPYLALGILSQGNASITPHNSGPFQNVKVASTAGSTN